MADGDGVGDEDRLRLERAAGVARATVCMADCDAIRLSLASAWSMMGASGWPRSVYSPPVCSRVNSPSAGSLGKGVRTAHVRSSAPSGFEACVDV